MGSQSTNNTELLPLAITMGEPAGIGPEIILKAWLHREQEKLPPFFVIGDVEYFRKIVDQFKLDVPICECTIETVTNDFHRALPILSLNGSVSAEPGSLHAKDAALVSGAITMAVELAIQDRISGIVTAPINKKALYDSGFEFPGHTEFLAALSKKQTGTAVTPIMMLAGPQLRTIPVTIHIPLSDVPKKLTSKMIIEAGQITAQDLVQRFGIEKPRLAISGLNPHAGENGAMGLEDQEIIAPAIAALQAMGIEARGPLPADTMFHASARKTYDAALCMYHDQALIPAKTLGFDDAVNVTLGLPFIRTSPDHGTALDIAAQGVASPTSLIAAIKMAGEMALSSAIKDAH